MSEYLNPAYQTRVDGLRDLQRGIPYSESLGRIKWSEDGRALAVSSSDGSIKVYMGRGQELNLKPVYQYQVSHSINDIAFTERAANGGDAYGWTLAAIGEHQCSLFWEGKDPVHVFAASTDPFLSVACLYRERKIYGITEKGIRIWEAPTNQNEDDSRFWPHDLGPVWLSVWGPNRERLALVGRMGLRIFYRSTEKFSARLPMPTSDQILRDCLVWSHDGEYIVGVSGHDTILVWKVAYMGLSKSEFELVYETPYRIRSILSLALSRDNALLLVKTYAAIIPIRTDTWTLMTALEVPYKGGRLGTVAWRPEHNQAATGDTQEKQVRIFDIQWDEVFQGNTPDRLVIPESKQISSAKPLPQSSPDPIIIAPSPENNNESSTVEEKTPTPITRDIEEESSQNSRSKELNLSPFSNASTGELSHKRGVPAEYAIGAQPTPTDSLGFKPTVEAVATFLKSKHTKPPFVLSVEGPWGTGKTSFMKQLEKALKTDRIFWYNAWLDQDAAGLWSSFAVEFTEQLRGKVKWFLRWPNDICLRFRRASSCPDRIILAALLFLIPVVLILVSCFLWALTLGTGAVWLNSVIKQSMGEKGLAFPLHVIQGGGLVGALALSAQVLGRLWKEFGLPVSGAIESIGSAPDYQSRWPFIKTFHTDLKKILNHYVGDERYYVFIDDVDRCDVPKAAELMEALNMMLSESPNLVFVIGMDRAVVAAGLNAKYEGLLPHLGEHFGKQGYGHGFLEKFLHLSIGVPQASPKEIRAMLKGKLERTQEQMGKSRVDLWSSVGSSALLPQNTGKDSAVGVLRPKKLEPVKGHGISVLKEQNVGEVPISEEERRGLEEAGEQLGRAHESDLEDVKDHDLLLRLAEAFSEYLDHNPRRVQVFLNKLHLRCLIAKARGYLSEDGSSKNGFTLTEAKIATLIVLEMNWPEVARAVRREPSLWNYILKEVLAEKEAFPQKRDYEEKDAEEQLLGPMVTPSIKAIMGTRLFGEFLDYTVADVVTPNSPIEVKYMINLDEIRAGMDVGFTNRRVDAERPKNS